MVLQGMHIFPVTFLFSGFCIFATGMFCRTFGWEELFDYLFPAQLCLQHPAHYRAAHAVGNERSLACSAGGRVSELFVTLIVLYANRNNYGYGKRTSPLLIDSQD